MESAVSRPMKDKAIGASHLIARLWPEVFQTEESARTHLAREARRLGDCPPAAAFLAVSDHAEESLDRLRMLATERGHKASMLGRVAGQAFSSVRQVSTDLLLSREKSYRASLLGIHHTIGVLALVEDAATASDDQALADFCATWLTKRRSLCAAAEEALAWFAANPAAATGRACSRRLGDDGAAMGAPARGARTAW